MEIKSIKYWVTMTDKFMSGWGLARGTINKLVIACDTYEQAEIIKRVANGRSEMKHVNICLRKPSYPRYLVSWKNYDDMPGWR
jgi:hypothetical protein|tara:strand:- start:10 stop:258 length:249 start_codon:yes stop_codon:yes gene_type:complete